MHFTIVSMTYTKNVMRPQSHIKGMRFLAWPFILSERPKLVTCRIVKFCCEAQWFEIYIYVKNITFDTALGSCAVKQHLTLKPPHGSFTSCVVQTV